MTQILRFGLDQIGVDAMTKDEQRQFVSTLSKAIVAEILQDISDGKVPDTWDGIELRQLMADRFARAVFSGYDYAPYREYCNVNNL